MPDITDAQFAEYSELKVTSPVLKVENVKLKETAENTKIALKANRDEIGTLKTSNENLQGEFDTFKTDSDEKLKQLDGFEEIQKDAKSWGDHQTAITEARTTKIEEMKTELGEDFMKTHESFLDGLPEDKIETFLTPHVEALDPEKSNVTTGTQGSGMKPNAGTKHSTKFDEAIGKGDAMAAFAEIPAPK